MKVLIRTILESSKLITAYCFIQLEVYKVLRPTPKCLSAQKSIPYAQHIRHLNRLFMILTSLRPYAF